MSILIKNAWIVCGNDQQEVIRGGYLFLENRLIKEMGASPAPPELEQRAETVIDAFDKIVLPGLVNAHTHLFQTFLRGLADDKPLFQWLKEEVIPFSLKMEPEDFYLAGLLGCLENLKTGATSVIDQHYIHTSPNTSDQVLTAMAESGIRGNLCRVFAETNYEERLSEPCDSILASIDRLHSQWNGAQNGRLCVSTGPINPWAVTAETVQRTKTLAREKNMTYQIHTAETTGVVQKSVDAYGKRNVEWLDSLGVLDQNTQLAHAVYLSPEEIQTVRRTGASVVHCPVANMYLASGVAPVPEYLNQGISVALATDGPGSNNSQDMLSVLKHTALLHKVHTLNAQILTPEAVLTMATAGGAKAMNRTDIGVLAPGKKADLILVDWQKPHIAPVHKPVSALVYNCNGNDVDTVIVDGRIVVAHKKSTQIDEDALVRACQERAEWIKNKA